MFFSVSFFITFATAISKSSCVTWALSFPSKQTYLLLGKQPSVLRQMHHSSSLLSSLNQSHASSSFSLNEFLRYRSGTLHWGWETQSSFILFDASNPVVIQLIEKLKHGALHFTVTRFQIPRFHSGRTNAMIEGACSPLELNFPLIISLNDMVVLRFAAYVCVVPLLLWFSLGKVWRLVSRRVF